MLISVEGRMALLSKQVAMTKCCPGRSILWKDLSHSLVVVDSGFIVALCGAELSHP